MSFSPALSRLPSHTRTIKYQSFEREDGLWDIEASLYDEKAFQFSDRVRGLLQPGDAIHDIATRVTINRQMEVLNIEVDFASVPFSFCNGGADGTALLIGTKLNKGWRVALNESLGRTHGCTHLKELLFGVATAAFQTFATNRVQKPREDDKQTVRPFYMDSCHSWAEDSPVVEKYFPQFFKMSEKLNK